MQLLIIRVLRLRFVLVTVLQYYSTMERDQRDVKVRRKRVFGPFRGWYYTGGLLSCPKLHMLGCTNTIVLHMQFGTGW